MSRRIDIELTSRSGDGTLTWRAAGAKQPKGTLGPELLPPGTSVGDVVRAEVESGLDGFEVVAVLARPDRAEEPPANRIEVLGAARRPADISVTYAAGSRRRREGDGEGRRERPGRHDGGGRPPGQGRHAPRGRGVRERAGAEPTGPGAGRGTTERGGAERGRGAGERGRPQRGASPGERRERRTVAPTAHRNAMLATLGPQELPVAEQLLRGGMPAVRQAIAAQNAPAGGEAPGVNADAVMAIAERLVPRVNLASWKDRAAGAQSAGRELRLRELRAVVTASRTVTLDEEGRAMARSLQEALDQRVTALREEWYAAMGRALDESRVLDALRAATQPPEPALRLPAALAVRLAEAAGGAMAPDVVPDAWLELLDAVVASPVRRTVRPVGIPDLPDVQDAARRAAGSVPELAKLLGLPIPPPPPPRHPPRRTVIAVSDGGRAAGR